MYWFLLSNSSVFLKNLYRAIQILSLINIFHKILFEPLYYNNRIEQAGIGQSPILIFVINYIPNSYTYSCQQICLHFVDILMFFYLYLFIYQYFICLEMC